MALPHLRNSKAGVNKWDPVHNSIFEVRFTLPEAIADQFNGQEDVELLSEHVLTIDGLDALSKAPTVSAQKFMGTTRSYIQTSMDSTSAEIKVKFSLNLRNDTDNIIYRIFRAWAALGYDINTGSRALKREYCADWLSVAVANRRGDVYHSVVFKDVMMSGNIGGLGSYDYSAGEAIELEVSFVSDWWDESMAEGSNIL